MLRGSAYVTNNELRIIVINVMNFYSKKNYSFLLLQYVMQNIKINCDNVIFNNNIYILFF